MSVATAPAPAAAAATSAPSSPPYHPTYDIKAVSAAASAERQHRHPDTLAAVSPRRTRSVPRAGDRSSPGRGCWKQGRHHHAVHVSDGLLHTQHLPRHASTRSNQHSLSCVISCRIPASTQATATFLAKADGTVAGLAVADMVCEQVDPSLKVTWSVAGAHTRRKTAAGGADLTVHMGRRCLTNLHVPAASRRLSGLCLCPTRTAVLSRRRHHCQGSGVWQHPRQCSLHPGG